MGESGQRGRLGEALIAHDPKSISSGVTRGWYRFSKKFMRKRQRLREKQ
jgi:hypothetical protein